MTAGYLDTAQGRRLAYDLTPGSGPGVVFLGGFRSDKEGSKALHLEGWARARGRAFLRFDYSGHGASSGAFEDGCIGDWAEDAAAAIGALTEGPQILVGSSMGGWIALLLARDHPERVAALVGIAAAPDFTVRLIAGLDADARDRLQRDGRLEVPSEYAPEPYVFTRRLIEDGARQSVLDAPLRLSMPVRLLQGTADTDVPVAAQMALFGHLEATDAQLTLVRGADHRFSDPACLALLTRTIEALA
ncbi:alpha/beta fold hydrolase [Rhodobaculum claviforme]|uniref:Palmitoyl-protein thioesterase ABHD10, mitochondrial n=1 Tax=Rhodobaculum claviforme TaxID=1549854 RepID=A0A934WHW3_9RHOB|nr:alpha/beta hydrolase [Rhodobaculum claviforme]MBK5926132.1 alpha/beta hydrolase [Rhodobaculum claviforme]